MNIIQNRMIIATVHVIRLLEYKMRVNGVTNLCKRHKQVKPCSTCRLEVKLQMLLDTPKFKELNPFNG